MDNAGYVGLTRQSGLMAEMRTIANNLANMATTGYRREGIAFAEHVAALRDGPSLSMATARGRLTDLGQGGVTHTGATFDLAIEGEGFFQVEGPDGPLLTRAGGFTPDAEGILRTYDGRALLDEGGAGVFVPPGVRGVAIGADGTISADGTPLGRIGLVLPADPIDLRRRDGVAFAAPGGTVPAENARLMQGALEDANVDPVIEIARMIEVQRAYELGQGLLDREDERIRGVIRTLSKA